MSILGPLLFFIYNCSLTYFNWPSLLEIICLAVFLTWDPGPQPAARSPGRGLPREPGHVAPCGLPGALVCVSKWLQTCDCQAEAEWRPTCARNRRKLLSHPPAMSLWRSSLREFTIACTVKKKGFRKHILKVHSEMTGNKWLTDKMVPTQVQKNLLSKSCDLPNYCISSIHSTDGEEVNSKNWEGSHDKNQKAGKMFFFL